MAIDAPRTHGPCGAMAAVSPRRTAVGAQALLQRSNGDCCVVNMSAASPTLTHGAPAFSPRVIWSLIKCSVKHWSADEAATIGASLAFYCAFSLAPLRRARRRRRDPRFRDLHRPHHRPPKTSPPSRCRRRGSEHATPAQVADHRWCDRRGAGRNPPGAAIRGSRLRERQAHGARGLRRSRRRHRPRAVARRVSDRRHPHRQNRGRAAGACGRTTSTAAYRT